MRAYSCKLHPHIIIYDNIQSYADVHGSIIHSIERQVSACKKIEARRKQEEWIVCNYPEPTRQGELNLFAA